MPRTLEELWGIDVSDKHDKAMSASDRANAQLIIDRPKAKGPLYENLPYYPANPELARAMDASEAVEIANFESPESP